MENEEKTVEETKESSSSNADESKETEQSSETDQEVIEKTLIDTDKDEDESEDKDDDSDNDADKEESTKFEMPELGEGVEIDTALFKAVTPVLEEMGATQEQVNKLAETFAGHLKQTAKVHGDAMIEKYNEIKREWSDVTKAEYGAKLKQEQLHVGNALKKFGTTELKELFNETGVGDHIEVFRMLSKIGKYFTEDKMEDGPSAGNESSAEDVLYPTMDK